MSALPLRPLFTAMAATGGVAGIALGQGAAVTLAACFATALWTPALAVLALPALLIWAPKLPLAVLGDEVFFLRLDQAVIAGMLGAWLSDRSHGWPAPPAHTAFLCFLMVLPASIIMGITQGTLATSTSAILYLGQWLTWYGLYLTTYAYAPRQMGWVVYAWTVPLLALAVYGIAESLWPYYEAPGVRYRTFERVWFPGQANHAGGLLALAAVTGVGLAANARYRVLGGSLAILATLALFSTGSRSGLLAWMAGMAALPLIYNRGLRWWLPPAGILALAAVPTATWLRHSQPGSSMYDRLIAWKSALSTLADFPLLGLGAGARHRAYYDNQYLMTLAESGAVGLVLLLVFLLALTVALARTRAAHAAPLAAGALAGMAVIGVHGLATASLVVTLVGGPCLWLCASVFAVRERQP